MSNNKKLIIACAGAGKSTTIAQGALERASKGQRVLIVTYTINNQKEIQKKICSINKFKPSNIVIKGWFAFLLEDMIRPYQRCLFSKRISNINFNASGDPHKNNRQTIPGTAEMINGVLNPVHFLTRSSNKAHTTYLSKLASRVHEASGKESSKRLAEIYNEIMIDEVQDLAGWDYEVISSLSKYSKLEITCVGDFRQTLYSTAFSSKKPQTSQEKLDKFKSLGFAKQNLDRSWRCIQQICTLADLVHAGEGYPATLSNVQVIPDAFLSHNGAFVISAPNLKAYLEQFKPVVLRVNKTTGKDICASNEAWNFGEAKGMGFARVLIIPTKKQLDFIKGKANVFAADKTDEARNTFYVAITRAHYSVAIIGEGADFLAEITVWKPEQDPQTSSSI